MADVENRIRALTEERKGYVLRGLAERVAQVDAEIRRLGGKPEKAVNMPAENAMSEPPKRPKPPVERR